MCFIKFSVTSRLTSVTSFTLLTLRTIMDLFLYFSICPFFDFALLPAAHLWGKLSCYIMSLIFFFLPFVYVTVCVHRLVLCLTLGICGLPCHFVWPSCPFVTCFSYRGTGWMSRGAPFLRLLRYNSSCSNTNYSFSLSTAAPPYLTLTDMAIISAFSITTCSS